MPLHPGQKKKYNRTSRERYRRKKEAGFCTYGGCRESICAESAVYCTTHLLANRSRTRKLIAWKEKNKLCQHSGCRAQQLGGGIKRCIIHCRYARELARRRRLKEKQKMGCLKVTPGEVIP